MTLGEIIKEYRTNNKLSMDTFADKSGISKAYISLLEKNKHPKTGKPISPSIQCIKQAADAMNMDFNILLSKIDNDTLLPDITNNITKPVKVIDSEWKYTLSDNRLGIILTNYCNQKNLSESDFAELLNISTETYQCLVFGKFLPSMQLIKKISDITKYEVDYLTGAIDHNSIPTNNIIKIGEKHLPISYYESDLTFRSRFEDLCINKNITDENCEEKITITRTQFIDIRHNRMPTLSELVRIAYAFNVSMDYLIGKTDTPFSGLNKDELELLLNYRECIEPYQQNIRERAYKLSLESKKESSVAADEPLKRTGTDSLGK